VTRKFFLSLIVLVLINSPLVAVDLSFLDQTAADKKLRGETVLLMGGPALRKWEDLREDGHQHDRWWANFVSATNIRTRELIKKGVDPNSIVWLAPSRCYAARQREDGKPYPTWINDLARKNGVRIRWYSTATEVLNYINKGQNRSSYPIVQFEFFGHSNKHAFLLDYSNRVSGASVTYIHERDLKMFKRGAFHRDAFIKSWGCHTGESFSKTWKREVGIPMWGAVGKTDYIPCGQGKLPVLSQRGDKWVQ